MAALVSIISSLVLFIFVMLIFTQEKLDYAVYALLAAIAACLIAYFTFRGTSIFPDPETEGYLSPLRTYLSYIEFDAIIFLISMQIIVAISEENKLFQWLALKVLHLVGGNHRLFFYLICTVSCLTASLISDITIAIIFVPLVIRATRILKIKTAPYIFGISFTVNIGSIYTPFSSAENILISSANGFQLDTVWFLGNFSLFVFPVLLLTLFVLDLFFVRKIKPPEEIQKTILLEIMSPSIVIVNKKKFILNWIYFGLIIVGLIIIPDAYLVSLIGVVFISIFNRKQFAENLKTAVDWKLITFLIATFLLIGTMLINGTFTIINNVVKKVIPSNTLFAAFVVLIAISVLSGVLAQVPTALVMIAILQQLYNIGSGGAIPDLIKIAFILGINIGSNFFPQGAAVDLMALNLAKKNKVEGFNYKTLLKNGSLITLFHIANSLIYMTLYYFITS
jgi:Na+/H+ antiporter NhaD/arsenite permease-like protein